MNHFEETRSLIIAYLKMRQENGQEPPYLNEMAEDLGLSLGTVVNHLSRLEGEGGVVKRASRRRPYVLAPESPVPGLSRAPSLSERQARILVAVEVMTREGGKAPSVREIAGAVGLASPASAQHHIGRLVEKGYLTRSATRGWRCLVLTPLGTQAIAERESPTNAETREP
ncbi:hypothetical protein [Streptomyces sp. AM 3-1-1]|uniref:LexA family protein n=1 Tax=Streptomyces sp. AM 3-1-1 TaxID=3028711 RepID=UPI0023B9EF36|nr:hypothetical protein [Streptomyces sp. AM 3-1-1]WEH29077.1 hypothetical protein P0D76_18095 [Streptomyces sp. AM 3-1-1]